MIRFQSVSKKYPDGTVALDGVTLEVPRGQFCVVLGSSGAGKSTLLRCVNGLVTPTGGTLEVDGIPLGRKTLRQARSRVSMIFQQFGLVNRLSVLQNVLCGVLARTPLWRAFLNLHPLDVKRKACALLHDVGLEETHLYRRAGRLSGGQQQRVAIARAFLPEPSVVLADEPVASLDQTTSVTILSLLRETSARRGATVLCSLHQLDLARQFADRVVGMRHGRVVFDGPPEGLTEAPLKLIYEGLAVKPTAGVCADSPSEPVATLGC